MIRKATLNVLRCQQCLGKLSFADDRLVCSSCGMVFPISKGLVFMGYDERKKDEIETIISIERDHQTNLDEVQQHYDFAYPSFEVALSSISILMLKGDVEGSNPIAIDMGCGGSPMSKILSEHGCDVYRCELDPNSLYSGLFWKHHNLGVGKHIVCDATILPFENNSVDIVFCKEFVHHVDDYGTLFIEVNRVLKKEGVFLMIEPTLEFLRPKDTKVGHYYQSICAYYSSLKDAGFFPYRYYLYYYGKSKRLRFLNVLKSFLHRQIYSGLETSKLDMFLKMWIQRLIGGSNVIFSRKVEHKATYKERPKIHIVDPSQLVLDERYLTDIRLERFVEILDDVRREI